MKRAKFFSGMIEKFKRLAKFKNKKHLNNHYEQWLLDIKDKLTKGELQAFKRLVRFMCKFPGVATAKIATMLKANYQIEGENTISRSTFERMLRKVKEWGVITIHHTIKKASDGRVKQGHSIYVFNPYNSKVFSNSSTIDVPKKKKLTEHKETSFLYAANNQNNNVTDVQSLELDASFTASYVPEEFVKAVKPFFGTAKAIEAFYKRYFAAVKKHNKKYGVSFDPAAMIDTGIEAFKQTIRALKLGTIKKDKYAFFYGTIREMLLDIQVELDQNPYSQEKIEYNWLMG